MIYALRVLLERIVYMQLSYLYYVLNFFLCKGCYQGGPCSVNRCHFVVNNTVGNCYFDCKTKLKHEGGCADTEHFYFGLQVTLYIQNVFIMNSV